MDEIEKVIGAFDTQCKFEQFIAPKLKEFYQELEEIQSMTAP